MFIVSYILTDTAMQSLSALADCSVSDTLVKMVPFLKQSFFHATNITDSAAVHSLLLNALDHCRWFMETIMTTFSLGIQLLFSYRCIFFHLGDL